MKRHRPWLLLSLLIPFLFSCSSTSPFVSNTTLSESLSIEEKLEAYGGREVYVQEPEMFFQGEEWLIRLEEEVEKAEDYILMSLYLGSSSSRLENLFSIMEEKAEEGVSGKARYLLIPLLLMIVGTIAYILYSGKGNMINGDAETGLIFGTAAGCLYLMIALAISKKISVKESTDNLFTGCGNMFGIVVIMVMAYAFSNLLGELGTADYLSGVLIHFLNPTIFTPIAFLLTCLLSFSTGTSAGTIAIMMPIMLPMAVSFHVPIPMIVGAVAGGAVFGDHTSPISDTTIMSCSSTGCDVVSHVKTQLPYSLCFAAAACVLYLVAGFVF